MERSASSSRCLASLLHWFSLRRGFGYCFPALTQSHGCILLFSRFHPLSWCFKDALVQGFHACSMGPRNNTKRACHTAFRHPRRDLCRSLRQRPLPPTFPPKWPIRKRPNYGHDLGFHHAYANIIHPIENAAIPIQPAANSNSGAQ